MIFSLIGYLGALIIGLTMGLLGGGGSILAVPIFVYLFGFNEILATAYSLFVVGVSSIAGTYSYFERNLIDFRTVGLFGIPATLSVFFNRYFLLPRIPEVLIDGDSFLLTKGMAVMILFSILMLSSSISMLLKKKGSNPNFTQDSSTPIFKIVLLGIGIGFITSLVGAGGGFLIVPAIVGLLQLPIKKAIGTSLSIIMMNSLIGFSGDIGNLPIDWLFLVKFSGLSILGIFLGSYFSRKISGARLKPAFGVFVLVMGTWILIKELFLN